jgi:hypothetical protein
LLTDWEIRAAAAATVEIHGDRAALVVASRIGSLALAGDLEGVAAWKAIAGRMADRPVAREAADDTRRRGGGDWDTRSDPADM